MSHQVENVIENRQICMVSFLLEMKGFVFSHSFVPHFISPIFGYSVLNH